MSDFKKSLRYYYWLSNAFIRKNLVFISISLIAGFFLIFVALQLFPYAVSLVRRDQVIGIVGDYNLDNLPSEVANAISNPMLAINEKGEILPVLIASWEILPGNKIYRFHLKSGLLWDDKRKFTAYDIHYQIKGVSIKPRDEQTIDFVLNQPLSIFPVYLTKPLTRYPLVGVLGSYRVQNIKRDHDRIKELRLIPNRSELGIKSYKFYRSDDELILAYKMGEITSFTTTRQTVVADLKSWPNTRVTPQTDFSHIITLFFNLDSPFLASRENRRAIVESTPISTSDGQRARSPIPPTSWAYSNDVRHYVFEPDKAKEFFAKNKSASDSAELSLFTFYDYLPIAEELKKSYESVGIKVALKVLSYIPDQYDMLLTSWAPPQDPDQYIIWHSTQTDNNISHYKNVKIDKYLEDGRKSINIDERKKIYHDFQKALVEDLPAYFMYYPTVYSVERK